MDHFIAWMALLVLAAPVAGVGLARATGTLSWPRALGFAAAAQVLVTLLYLRVRGFMYVRFGTDPITDRELLVAKARFVGWTLGIALLLAALLTGLWRWRGRA